jgi:hypothetical protein
MTDVPKPEVHPIVAALATVGDELAAQRRRLEATEQFVADQARDNIKSFAELTQQFRELLEAVTALRAAILPPAAPIDDSSGQRLN